jgi:hypothetical protein
MPVEQPFLALVVQAGEIHLASPVPPAMVVRLLVLVILVRLVLVVLLPGVCHNPQ